MSYSKLVKQWKKEHKQKLKLAEKEREYEQQLNERIIASEILINLRLRREAEQLQKQENENKHSLRLWARSDEAQRLFNRVSWLIWDIINDDYITTINDIKRARQTKIDVLNTLYYIRDNEIYKNDLSDFINIIDNS